MMTTTRVVIVLGGPASGKGTQCARIGPMFGLLPVSAGELVREAKHSPLTDPTTAKLIQEFDGAGKLLTGELVWQIIRTHIHKALSSAQPHSISGFLLDGFPRTPENLEVLLQAAPKDGITICGAISLCVPDSVMMSRALGRGATATASSSATQSNVRWDDTDPAVIKRRIDNFHAQTEFVIKHWEKEGLLFSIDGTIGIDNVTEQCENALQKMGFLRIRKWPDQIVPPLKEDYPGCIKIVFSGGPAGGKTSCMESAAKALQLAGFHVLCCPETPTLVITGGASLHGLSPERFSIWEKALLELQMTQEDVFERMARVHSKSFYLKETNIPGQGGQVSIPAVVLCDRGTMDVSAFLPVDVWRGITSSMGQTDHSLRDQRYCGVIHLASTATDTSGTVPYSTDNNKARSNGLSVAKDFDERFRKAWVNHPCWQLVEPTHSFLEKQKAASRAVLALCRPLTPPPLPIRVIIQAEPFGFGPSAAAAQFFRYLRPRIAWLAYAGTGHTLDIQRPLGYDAIYDLNNPNCILEASVSPESPLPTNLKTPYERLAAVCQAAKVEAVLISCDITACEHVLQVPGVSVALYDPLAWYWKPFPSVCQRVDLYLPQDYFDVRKLLASLTFRAIQIVSPIVSVELSPPSRPRADLALLNLGGLQNPILTVGQCQAFGLMVATAIVPAFTKVHKKVEVVGAKAIVEGLKSVAPQARTVEPEDVQRMLKEAALAVMTPGLGNIYEAAALSAPVFWLPPANDSQGQQLRTLQSRNIAPFAADWHELLPDIVTKPIDYSAAQPVVMKQVAEAMQAAQAHPEQFTRNLSAKVEAALASPQRNMALHTITEMFGRGGDVEVAIAFWKLCCRRVQEKRQ